MTTVEPGGNDDGSLITRKRGSGISGQTYFYRSLVGNSRGQHDLNEQANAGDDDAGKQEPAADHPFRNTGSGRTLHRARGWSESAIEGVRVTYSEHGVRSHIAQSKGME